MLSNGVLQHPGLSFWDCKASQAYIHLHCQDFRKTYSNPFSAC